MSQTKGLGHQPSLNPPSLTPSASHFTVSVLAMFSSCPDPTPLPEMAAVNKSFASMAGEQVAAVYACQPGYAWLSGQDFAVTQCLNGNWTPIMDMCDTGEFSLFYLCFLCSCACMRFQ